MGWRAVSVKDRVPDARPAAAAGPPQPHVQPRRALRTPIPLNLRLGAGYGGRCGGDARVPGGAETAAERAADPGGA